MGIRTIGELAESDPAWLKGMLKKQGELVWRFANGIDISSVLDNPSVNKGYGNSTTTPVDVTDSQTARQVLLALAETVGSRIRSDKVQIQTVSVRIRYADMTYVSHQEKLRSSTDLTLEIYRAACRLFADLWDGSPVRHLGVHTGSVRKEDFVRQAELFDKTDYEKLAGLDAVVDGIRNRYGMDTVMRAVILNQPFGRCENAKGNSM